MLTQTLSQQLQSQHNCLTLAKRGHIQAGLYRSGYLGCVCLGGRHTNLTACVDVHATVRAAGYCGAHSVCDPNTHRPLRLCILQSLRDHPIYHYMEPLAQKAQNVHRVLPRDLSVQSIKQSDICRYSLFETKSDFPVQKGMCMVILFGKKAPSNEDITTLSVSAVSPDWLTNMQTSSL